MVTNKREGKRKVEGERQSYSILSNIYLHTYVILYRERNCVNGGAAPIYILMKTQSQG